MTPWRKRPCPTVKPTAQQNRQHFARAPTWDQCPETGASRQHKNPESGRDIHHGYETPYVREGLGNLHCGHQGYNASPTPRRGK